MTMIKLIDGSILPLCIFDGAVPCGSIERGSDGKDYILVRFQGEYALYLAEWEEE